MKYVDDLHIFAEKLANIMIRKGMIDKKGNPDKIALYKLLYPDEELTDHEFYGQSAVDKTRKISNWLKGNSYPKSVTDVLDLCNALDCDLDYFFTDMEAPTHDIAFISEQTNLSCDSILNLQSLTEYEQLILDTLLSKGYFKDICFSIYSYMQTLYKDMNIKDKDTGTLQELTDSEKLEIAEYRATKHFSNLLINKLATDEDIQKFNGYEHDLEHLIHALQSIPKESFKPIEELRKMGYSREDIYNMTEDEINDIINEKR